MLFRSRCALGYHQILREGFRRLHGKQSSLGVSGDEDVTGAEMIEAQSGDSTDLYRKVLRVKAKKTMVWLENEDSVYRLFMSVISVPNGANHVPVHEVAGK